MTPPPTSQLARQSDNQPHSLWQKRWRGTKASLPVLLGTIPYALVLGAQARQKGLSLMEVPLLTGLNFAGGSEFAAVQLWADPPPVLTIVLVTFLVNSRHLLMGAVLSPFLRDHKPGRILPALFALCDESWALSLAESRKREKEQKTPFFCFHFYTGVAVPFFLAWVLFTTLGAVIGPILGPIDRYGFDMAFPAVFLTLLVSMWEGWQEGRPWLVSLIVAACTHLLFPRTAWFVLAGTISGLIFAALQPPEQSPSVTARDKTS